ncbi:MAG TPA: hypothetical protein EYQ56_02310 [Methylophilaceae bacterium]|jgi:hypothetical protein|nr:hypothetical protein [Methylophilaceae bacterium]
MITTSRKNAINNFCFSCIVDERNGNGSKHEQTTNCTSYQCHLYDFRPITSAEKSRRNDEKLKGMSKAELEIYEAKRAKKAAVFRQNVTKANVSSTGGG